MTKGLGWRTGPAVLAALALAAAGPAAAQTSLSIYTDGRVVVRRTVAQPLERGRTVLVLPFEDLDPATLFSPDAEIAILGATQHPPTTRAAALAAAVGRTLPFVRDKGDTVRATVVRADPPQYRLGDGRMLLEQPGEPLFPAELVRSVPETRVVVQASRARPHTALAYVTAGASWEATYQVLLGRRASVAGIATVRADHIRAENVEVQVVAGSIRRVRQPDAPRPTMALRQRAGFAMEEEAAAGEQAVGEAHVYMLPGRHTVEPGVPTAVALFPRVSTAYEREFVVPGVLPWRGGLGRMPEEQRAPVQVWYTLRRARGSDFGDRPLPGGTVQLYESDEAGRAQLVGEAAVGHTPAGAGVRVQAAEAFDVTAERVQTDYRIEDLGAARRNAPPRRITVAYRVVLTSAKPEAVVVGVREARLGEWRIVESSVPADKLSASEVRFRVTVPAEGEAVLTYIVQVDT